MKLLSRISEEDGSYSQHVKAIFYNYVSVYVLYKKINEPFNLATSVSSIVSEC